MDTRLPPRWLYHYGNSMPLSPLDRCAMFLYFAQCVTVPKDLALLRSSLYSPDPVLLKGRVALVTGSGRGIGRAIARLFASEGAAVFLTARTHAELVSTSTEINKFAKAGFVTGDLTRALDCARVVGAARKKFRRIDILVNNAGHYGPVVPVEEYPLQGFERVINVHLRAAFLLSKLALPGMYARKSGVI